MQTVSSVMEMLMVVCFGISWPLNIIKAFKACTAEGSSVLFYWFIWIGYLFAIIGKIALIIYHAPQPWYLTVRWYVMFFYLLNTLMVSCGILIYLRNKKLDQIAQRGQNREPAKPNGK